MIGAPAVFDRVWFAYQGEATPVLADESWEISPGTLSVIVGSSGSGKSTLLRCFNGLVPHFTGGRFGGTVRIVGRDTRNMSPRDLGRSIGFVFQDPEAQLLTDRVESDIAFGLEQAGVDRATMRCMVDWAIEITRISHLTDRHPARLSGGERQRVAIAAALAVQPALLVLDEPTSQLDPHGAQNILEAIDDLQDRTGTTIVVAEHRLEHLLGRADILKMMGKEVACGPVRDVVAQSDPTPFPPVVRLARRLGVEPAPLTLEEAGTAFANIVPIRSSIRRQADRGSILGELRDVKVDLAGRTVLQDIAFEIREGEIVALVGQNGSGKTTLLRALAGLQPIATGDVSTLGNNMRTTHPADLNGEVGYVPQQAMALFSADRLMSEFGRMRVRHRSSSSPDAMLRQFRLDGHKYRNPLDLSGGERERAALAIVMSRQPRLLLLDEPTRGMDAWHKQELADVLGNIRQSGVGIVLATHDADLVAACATRVVALDRGRIIADGSPGTALVAAGIMPQLTTLWGSEFLTVDDVLAGLLRRNVESYAECDADTDSAASARYRQTL